MRTYWGFVCLSHEPPIESDRWLNRGEDELARIWALRHHIAALAGSDTDLVLTHHLGVEPWWVAAHADCRVLLASEYEDRLDPAEVCARLGVAVGDPPPMTAGEFGTAMGTLEALLWRLRDSGERGTELWSSRRVAELEQRLNDVADRFRRLKVITSELIVDPAHYWCGQGGEEMRAEADELLRSEP